VPNVPNVPGVPKLSSYSANPFPLLFADALAFAGLLAPSQWGIFLKGFPVIQPATVATQAILGSLSPVQQVASLVGVPNIVPVTASTIDFEFAEEFPLSNYPQEQGAFQSYNKVELPFDVKVKLACGGSTATRQAFLTTCLAISKSLALFDVQTPEIIFQSCNVTHIDWRRNARAGVTLIHVDLWFQQISVTSATTFTNTQQPAEAGQKGIGVVQPKAPPAEAATKVQTVIENGGGGW
jgi:hypothetical protein